MNKIILVLLVTLIIIGAFFLINVLLRTKQPVLIPKPTMSPVPITTISPTSPTLIPTDTVVPICVDRCGDGVCQEIVCMAVGCPCSENPQTCPQDCH